MESVDRNEFVIENGRKAHMICRFFDEENVSIVRDGIAYDIDDVLTDEVELPASIEPEDLG